MTSDRESASEADEMAAFLAWREEMIEPVFQPVLRLVQDLQDDEDLEDCEARVHWEGLRHHWSLVHAVEAGGGYRAYLDVCLDFSDPAEPRLEVRVSPLLPAASVDRFKAQVAAAVDLAVGD